MFKFLRKYSVWILGFGGTLLLIAFLAPNVIQQLAQRAGYAGTTQATVGDGETVGFDEWHAGNLSYHLKSRPKWFPRGIPLNMMEDSYDAEIFFNEYNFRVIGKK